MKTFQHSYTYNQKLYRRKTSSVSQKLADLSLTFIISDALNCEVT